MEISALLEIPENTKREEVEKFVTQFGFTLSQQEEPVLMEGGNKLYNVEGPKSTYLRLEEAASKNSYKITPNNEMGYF